MTDFTDIWEKDLLSRASELHLSLRTYDEEIEIIKLLCNMAYIQGNTEGYCKGREDAKIAYNEAFDKLTGNKGAEAKLWPVGTNENGD